MLKLDLTFFLIMNALLITNINNKYIRKILNVFLMVLGVLDLVAIKTKNTHINYDFIANIDFSIVFILFTLFKETTYKTIIFIVIASLLIIKYEGLFHKLYKKHMKIMLVVLTVATCLAMMPDGVWHNIYKLGKDVCSVNGNMSVNEICIELGCKDDYILSEDIQAKEGKNIIIIYVESLEQNYLDEELFSELTPNLNNLKKQWSFYNNYKQIVGTGWTVGALYSTQVGLPANFGLEGNQIFQRVNKTQAASLGMILKNAGYQEVFLTGTDLNFAGTGNLMQVNGYQTIGNNEIIGDYSCSEWGIRDSDLFTEAKKQYLKLSQENKPFNLSILTVDTHFPNGVVDERLRNKLNTDTDNMEYAIKSIDYILNDFILFLKKQPNYDNLAIYIIPDHLVMGDETTTPIVKKLNQKNRKLFVLTNQKNIFDYDNINAPITYIDIPQIILNGANVEHNAKFLNKLKPDINESFIAENSALFTKLNLKLYTNYQLKDLVGSR